MENQLEQIVAVLQGKAALKQSIHNATRAVFQILKATAATTISTLQKRLEGNQPPIELDFDEVGIYEFRLQCAGDSLIFQMQTDVQTFDHEHLVYKSPYIQEEPHRAFFGSIVVHNFMADSVRYNRLNDAGYLLARLLLNCEGHYYIEGPRQLNFLHPDIAQNVVDQGVLEAIVQSCLLMAIDTDLMAPPFQDIQIVALGEKLQDQMAGSAKVGFEVNAKAK